MAQGRHPQAQIRKVMCEYWVVGEPERSVEAWTVMHSTSIFLMDGEGRYLTHIPSEAAPADIAAGIKPYL